MRVSVTVTIELDTPIREIGRNHLKDHIENAIATTGDRDPMNDPLFGAISTVRCGPIKVIKPKSGRPRRPPPSLRGDE